MLEYSILAGILFGLYFTLVGLGLNLVFGVMRIVNLAHGDFLVLGAFIAISLSAAQGVHPVVSVFVVLAMLTVIGIPLYYLLVPRLLRGKDPEMLSIILFFGLSQMIEALLTIVVGPSERSIPSAALGSGPIHLAGRSFPAAWLVTGLVSTAAVGMTYVYLYKTRLGLLTRAVMAHRDEALATGIDVDRVSAFAFGIGLALAGIAGVFAPFMLGSVRPGMGVEMNIQAFAVIVIGSLGNPLGTILGGLVYGICLMVMQTYFSSWAALVPYTLLIAILLIRPTGILGRRVRRA